MLSRGTVATKAAQPILIRGARQLLTLRGPRGPRRGSDLKDPGVIHDGALLIRDGVVQEVGPTRRVENLAEARDALEINAVGRVVMPGFVDSHTHLVFPGAGAESGDAESARRAVHTVSAKLLAIRAQAYLKCMARHGTTTVEAKTGCGPDEAAELKVLRAMAVSRGAPLDLIPTFLMRLPEPGAGDIARIAAATWVITEFLPLIRRRGLAVCADVDWDPDPALYPMLIRYLEAARQLGFARKVHDLRSESSGSVLAAIENGALSVDHIERTDRAEWALLARGSTVATVLPAGILQGTNRTVPARALVDHGAALAVATNFNACESPLISMQTVIWLACAHLGLTPAEALSAATINGAHALGLGEQTGSLEIGKSADVLMLNIGDYRELGDQLGTNLVHLTMKRGEFIYQEGQVAPRPAEEVWV